MKKLSIFVCSLIAGSIVLMAQQPTINNFRPYDKGGVGIFEAP